MYVSIEHEDWQKFNWFGADTTYSRVMLSVTFSEAEIYSIENLRLGSMTILERTPDANKGGEDSPAWDITFSYLLDLQRTEQSDVYCLVTPLEAKQYEETLTEALEIAKECLEGNREIVGMPTTFRL